MLLNDRNNLSQQLVTNVKDIINAAELNMKKFKAPYDLLSLTASIKIKNADKGNEFSDEQMYITSKLNKLGIRPSEVVIENFETYVVYWYAKEQLVISTQQQFVEVVLPFIIFLQENISPFFEYCFDCKEMAICGKFEENKRVAKVLNNNPEFDGSCFGNLGEIRIQHLY